MKTYRVLVIFLVLSSRARANFEYAEPGSTTYEINCYRSSNDIAFYATHPSGFQFRICKDKNCKSFENLAAGRFVPPPALQKAFIGNANARFSAEQIDEILQRNGWDKTLATVELGTSTSQIYQRKGNWNLVKFLVEKPTLGDWFLNQNTCDVKTGILTEFSCDLMVVPLAPTAHPASSW